MGKENKGAELFGQDAYQPPPEQQEEEVKHVPDELPIVWGYFSEGTFMWAKPKKVGFYQVPYIPADRVRKLRDDLVAAYYCHPNVDFDVLLNQGFDKLLAETEK